MDAKRAYEREFLSGLARLQDAACLTGLRADALHDLLLGLDDATPDRRAWDEAIMEARNAD